MICSAIVRFRQRREPFPYDFEGRTGTYYSFEGIDEDDTKCQVGCSEEQWNALADVERGTPLQLVLTVKKAKVYEDGIALADVAAARS